MKVTIVTSVLLLTIGCFGDDGWKTPRSVEATIAEKVGEEQPRTIELVQADGILVFKTNNAVLGELAGVSRYESIGPNGIFTWLEGNPSVAMQLFAPSNFDVVDYLARPRFSRGDLELNVRGIERSLGKRVLVGASEEIAGRPTLVLTIPDRLDSAGVDYQKVWIDRETGVTMKQQDYFGGKATYEREILRIDYRPSPADEFKMRGDATIIRGLVSPATLMRLSNLGTAGRFNEDIARINAEVKPPVTKWAVAFDKPDQFGYAQTNFRELRSHILPPGQARQGEGQQSQQGQRRQNQLAAAQQAAARVGDAIVVLDDPQVTRRILVTIDADGNRQVVETTSDGRTVASSTRTEGRQAEGPRTLQVAQSDFVDPKTGHTLTLLQAHGRDIEPSLSMLFSLGQPTDPEDQSLPEAKVYRVSAPFAMTILVWKKGEARYGLASTSLSQEQLIEIAARVRMP